MLCKLKKIDPDHFRIAIFGSARISPNDARYKEIYNLAKHIAMEGFDVVTGGGPGVMEAANKGHKEGRKNNDVHSFGLNILLPNEQMSNKHLDIKRDFKRFSSRLDYFMSLSNVVVVAPGGVGTMLELFYTWQLIQVEHICSIPIIFVGNMWPPLIEWVKKYPLKMKFLDKNDLMPLFFTKNYKEAIKIIKSAHEEHKKGNPDYCSNFDKYRLL